MYYYFRMETARRVMEHYFPAHYRYWLTIAERLEFDTDRELLSMAWTQCFHSIYTTTFCPIAPYGFKSKYYRDMCLSIASVAFPDECKRLFITVPNILGDRHRYYDRYTTFESILLKANPAVVQVLNLKMQIAAEKAEVKRLTAEHKATLKQLKIKKSDESVSLPE